MLGDFSHHDVIPYIDNHPNFEAFRTLVSSKFSPEAVANSLIYEIERGNYRLKEVTSILETILTKIDAIPENDVSQRFKTRLFSRILDGWVAGTQIPKEFKP